MSTLQELGEKHIGMLLSLFLMVFVFLSSVSLKKIKYMKPEQKYEK